jgi:hypothetical protein
VTTSSAAKKAARRLATPLIERVRPVLTGASEQRAASAQANVAALEILVAGLRSDVVDLQKRITELEAER